MAYLLLLGAILAEVAGTIATRFSEGFTRLVPSTLAVGGVVLAYYLFSLTLKQGTNIGVAYAIWAALGVTLVAILGAVFLGDTLSAWQVFGIVLVIAGVMTLELGSAPA
jgi:small multidrug resistance pump